MHYSNFFSDLSNLNLTYQNEYIAIILYNNTDIDTNIGIYYVKCQKLRTAS